MATYKEKLSYGYVKNSKDCLSKALEWIDNLEKDKAEMLIPQVRKLAVIYENIKKLNIEMNILLEDISKTLEV